MISKIEELEKELVEMREEIKKMQDSYNKPERDKTFHITSGDPSKFSSGQIGNMKCLWDSIPAQDRYKPMGMSCPCPKCTPWC